MKVATAHLEHLPTESIQLPVKVASRLKEEAKKNRLSIPDLIAQWLEDQSDIRDATAVMNRVKAGKEKTIPAEEIYKRNGI